MIMFDLKGEINDLVTVSPPRKHLCTKIFFVRFFFFCCCINVIDFHTVVRLLFLQLKVQSNLFRHEAYKSSKIITLNLKPCLEVQTSLAVVFCVFPHAILKRHRDLFVFSSFAFFTRLEIRFFLSSAVRSAPCWCQIADGNVSLCP